MNLWTTTRLICLSHRKFTYGPCVLCYHDKSLSTFSGKFKFAVQWLWSPIMCKSVQQTCLILAYRPNLIFGILDLCEKRKIFETSYYTLVIVQLMQICKTEEFVSIKTKTTLDTLDTTQAGISHDRWIPAVSTACCILPWSDPTFNMAPINQFPISFSENYWRPS